MSVSAFSDNRTLRRRVLVVLACYEAALILVILAAGANIALTAGGTLAGGAPLVIIGLAEATRMPIAAWATRTHWTGRVLAIIALSMIALASFDGLVLVFQIFVDNRLTYVLRAQESVAEAARALDVVEHARDGAETGIAQLAGEVAGAGQQIKDLSVQMPKAATSAGTCMDKRGRRVSCGADTLNAQSFRVAVADYQARLSVAMKARETAQRNLDAAHARADAIDDRPAKARLSEAKDALARELAASPFYRAVAMVFAVPVSNVTDAEFQQVKRVAVIGLAGSFSTLSMMAALVVNAAPMSDRPGRIERAIRAYFARKRRPLIVRRDVPVVEFRDRIVVKWVPFSEATGHRIKSDGEPGEVISPTWTQKT